MKHWLSPVYALITVAFFTCGPVHASNEANMVVSIETDSFILHETGIGSLAVGESKTIETESGQVVDLLRTADGVEIYIDGELIDPGFHHGPGSDIHLLSKHVEITCDDEHESNCETHVEIHTQDDGETSAWSSEVDDAVAVHDDIEITCTSDDGKTHCSEHVVWVTKGGEIDIESLHEGHVAGKGHEVIVIKKKKTGSHD